MAAREKQPPLKIGILCESFGALGGVPQIVEELAVGFADAGHRVAIISNPHKGKNLERPQHLGVEQVWVELPRAKPFSIRHPERLWRHRSATDLAGFIKRWSPDVMNIHGGLRDRFPAVLSACNQARVPTVQSFHLVPEASRKDGQTPRLDAFARRALVSADAITFPSNAVKDGFKQIWPESERAHVIRGGVNLEAASSATPFTWPRPYIFSASRLDLHHKAVDRLIESFCLLSGEFADIDLLIAGDGPQRSQVESMIAAAGLATRIHLLSSLAHQRLWSLYKGAWLFVMLSRKPEGLPLVFFEAMACATPVIATRTGGTPEIISHQNTGILVERNEPGEVAEAIRGLLTNPDQRKRLGRRGAETVQRYDWRDVALNYLKVYRSVLTSNR